MRKTWRLNGVSETYQIVRRSDVPEKERIEVNPHLASLYVDRWLADPFARQSMVEMYESVSGRAGAVATRLRGGDLHRYIKPGLTEAFRRGEFVLLRVPHHTIIPAKEDKEEQPKEEEQQPSPEPPKKKTWVEVVLVDEDDNPVPNVRFELELPDGSKKSGNLDAEGKTRVTGIDPGTCKVSFPELDARDWEEA